MAQFGVYRMRGSRQLVCRVQTDIGVETAYVLCAPVFAAEDWTERLPGLHLPITLDGQDHVVLMSQMIALPHSTIGQEVGSAATARDGIVRAVDLLVSGF